MSESTLREILQEGVAQGVAPGMAAAVGTKDRTLFADVGHFTFASGSPPVTQETLWDIASLTKIVATTSVAMSMQQSNELDLDAHVQSAVAEFVGEDKDDVTVRNLLHHDSGLSAYGNYEKITNALEVKDTILRSALRSSPGKSCVYSCLGFVTLAEVEQRLSGIGFDELFQKRVAGPLGMKDTLFKPGLDDRKRSAPTERYIDWRKKLEDLRGYQRVHATYIQGSVHDPIAFLIGGVSGNAGLFSTSRDLAKIARAWLVGDGPFKRETLDLFTKRQDKASTYALGFDTRDEEDSSAGTKFSIKSFGHTGFTGTTIWVDPVNGLFAVLLTNRVNPTAANLKIRDFRPSFHDAVFDLLK